MPEYDFQCDDPKCNHIFIEYYGWKTDDGINFLDDPNMQNCPECKCHATQLFSKVVMRPDTHWNGVYFDTTDYYSTSKSKYERWMKHHWEDDMERSFEVIGDRTDRESLTKICREAEISKEKKREKILEDFLIEELAPVDMDQYHNDPEKMKNLESAHPEDVFIDPAFV